MIISFFNSQTETKSNFWSRLYQARYNVFNDPAKSAKQKYVAMATLS